MYIPHSLGNFKRIRNSQDYKQYVLDYFIKVVLIGREGKFISGIYFPVICLDLIEPRDAAKSRKLILITQLL